MISIRKAIAGDIDQFKNVVVDSVLKLCSGYYTAEQMKSLLAQYPSRDVYEKWIHERVLLVAEDEGGIVGFAQYFPPNGSIEAVHVLPSYVKQGVGRMLVESIEEIAEGSGAKRITLDSSLNAVGFYEKCGYLRKEDSVFQCNDRVELRVVNYEKLLCS